MKPVKVNPLLTDEAARANLQNAIDELSHIQRLIGNLPARMVLQPEMNELRSFYETSEVELLALSGHDDIPF